jgi:hypothetical protein
LPLGWGVVLGTYALVTGVAGRKRVKRGEANNNRATIAGIALGIIAIIIGSLISIVTIIALYLIEKNQLCIAGAHTRTELLQCH